MISSKFEENSLLKEEKYEIRISIQEMRSNDCETAAESDVINSELAMMTISTCTQMYCYCAYRRP